MMTNIYNWIKKKIKWFLVATGLVAVAFAAGPIDQTIFDSQTPEELRMKAPVERILDSRLVLVNEGDEDEERYILYSYRSELPSEPFDNEIKRTPQTVTQSLGGGKRMETSYLGQRFYKEKDSDPWYDVLWAKTSEEVFNKKTSSGFLQRIFAADTGVTNPGTMANDATVGNKAWTLVDNAKVSDGVYAGVGAAFGVAGIPKEYSIKVVKADDSYSATDKSTGANLESSDIYRAYGGSSELWGETWTIEDINNSNFGVGFSCEDTDGNAWISNYLKATNFGFSIPDGATIDGIKVEVKQKYTYPGGRSLVEIDHMRITVYYTEAVSARRIIDIE